MKTRIVELPWMDGTWCRVKSGDRVKVSPIGNDEVALSFAEFPTGRDYMVVLTASEVSKLCGQLERAKP